MCCNTTLIDGTRNRETYWMNLIMRQQPIKTQENMLKHIEL